MFSMFFLPSPLSLITLQMFSKMSVIAFAAGLVATLCVSDVNAVVQETCLYTDDKCKYKPDETTHPLHMYSTLPIIIATIIIYLLSELFRFPLSFLH